jgi:hypothetical protein
MEQRHNFHLFIRVQEDNFLIALAKRKFRIYAYHWGHNWQDEGSSFVEAPLRVTFQVYDAKTICLFGFPVEIIFCGAFSDLKRRVMENV